MAVGAAAGVAGYLTGRAVGRAIPTDAIRSGAIRAQEDGGPRSYLRAVTIYRPPSEVYAFWRDLPNLAQALGHVVRVDEVGDRRSRWIVEGPGSSEVEFMVEIVTDEPQRVIEWRADDAPVPHEGRVEFTRAPGGRGTEVRLYVTFLAGAPSGSDIGPLTGDLADRLLYDGLRRVKQIMEAGEVIRVEGQSSGRDAIPPGVTAAVVPPTVTGGRE
jgi:uncharacterized membrane protein